MAYLSLTKYNWGIFIMQSPLRDNKWTSISSGLEVLLLESLWILLSLKAMVFPVVMYGCESWTVKKAEHRRIDAFELWYWRRLLRVPWTARRSNQSILKEISPGFSLEEMMLKLKLQYFCEELTHWKRLWCWEGLGQEEKGTTEDEMAGWHHRLNGREFEWTPGVGNGQGSLVCMSMGTPAVHGVAKSRTRLSDWTELNYVLIQKESVGRRDHMVQDGLSPEGAHVEWWGREEAPSHCRSSSISKRKWTKW